MTAPQVFDRAHDRYLLVDIGWPRGVLRDRIVLAFKPPDVRKYTDFAAA